MAMTEPTIKTPSRGFRLRTTTVLGLLALLAPVAYLSGRVSTEYLTDTLAKGFANGVAAGALGVMIGIPIGLFFGSQRSGTKQRPRPANNPNTREMERGILEQLRQELAENRSLFDARKGSTTMFARIDYISPFWTAIKASGRLFVMQNSALLNTIATAYYWLDQATHLERLAYEAKYSAGTDEPPVSAEKLIIEARLLDGQIESTLDQAIDAIDSALAAFPPKE